MDKYRARYSVQTNHSDLVKAKYFFYVITDQDNVLGGPDSLSQVSRGRIGEPVS